MSVNLDKYVSYNKQTMKNILYRLQKAKTVTTPIDFYIKYIFELENHKWA